MEVGYMAAMEADKEIVWMMDFNGELRIQLEEYRFYWDNQKAIHLANNIVYHFKMKHT